MKIAQKPIRFFTVLFFTLLILNSVFAGNPEETERPKSDGERVNTEEQIVDYIKHHLKDAHDFHLWSYTNKDGERKHVSLSLPVIVWSSKGPVAFMSSAFHHNDDGQVLVERKGLKFAKIHEEIYELYQGATTVAFNEEHHPVNAHKILDTSITKSVIGILIIGLLMLWWFSSLAKQYKTKRVPTGFGRVLEPLVIYVRDEMARPNIGEKHYRKFTGYLLTVFFFIWISNMLGLMPFGFNVTGQLAVTGALAVFTLIIYTFSSNANYWKHMLWMPGVPYLIRPILAVIEIAGAFLIKPFALLVRLFANISAGHIVVMSLIAIMITLKQTLTPVGSTALALVLSFFITLIEVLVAFLQAYIFTMLSALFIGMAVHEEDHH